MKYSDRQIKEMIVRQVNLSQFYCTNMLESLLVERQQRKGFCVSIDDLEELCLLESQATYCASRARAAENSSKFSSIALQLKRIIESITGDAKV